MKHSAFTVLLCVILRLSFAQENLPDLNIFSLKEIFIQVDRIDTLCSGNKYLVVHSDGDSSSCSGYYKNSQVCVKDECDEVIRDGVFTTIQYPSLKNHSSLIIVEFRQDGLMKFKMYLFRVKSEIYELQVMGARNAFAGEIENIKIRALKTKYNKPK
ncbi:MAG: hypothetical protein ACOYNC_07160 [Bacteroidales bacterium]